MPSWPTRLLSSSHASTNPPLAPSPDRAARSREGNALNFPTSESLVAVPTLRPSPRVQQNGGSPSSRNGSNHGRSLSHPFPSIFGYGKKPERTLAAEDDAQAFELTDDEVVYDIEHGTVNPSLLRGKSKASSDKDLITGSCMTCDSMMRWPRSVKTFRCSVCGMVNDLKPWLPEDLDTSQKNGPRNSPPGSREKVSGKPLPLSVERTNSIIDHCITTFLERRCHRPRPRSRSPLPPRDNAPELERRGSGAGFLDPMSAELGGSSTLPKALPTVPPNQDHPAASIQASGLSRSLPGPTRSGFEQMHSRPLPLPPSRRPPRPPDESSPRHTVSTQNDGRASDSKGATAGLQGLPNQARSDGRGRQPDRQRSNAIFGPLEDYIVDSFRSWECINSSFPLAPAVRPGPPMRAVSEGSKRSLEGSSQDWPGEYEDTGAMSNLDAKTLLLGDFAENGSWWSGGRGAKRPPKSAHGRNKSSGEINPEKELISGKSPRLDWAQLNLWYSTVLHAGRNWNAKLRALLDSLSRKGEQDYVPTSEDLQDIENQMDDARFLVHRKLLKATENLLKRPGRPLKKPEETRFLLVVLANPLLYSKNPPPLNRAPSSQTDRRPSPARLSVDTQPSVGRSPQPRAGPGQHSSIVKRILGLLSNLPHECHLYLVAWLSRFSESHFRRTVDLVGGFVTYRLGRPRRSNANGSADPTAGLIPNLSGPGASTSAQLHAALGVRGKSQSTKDQSKTIDYSDDWQIRAAAKVMALLFTANNSGIAKKTEAVFAAKAGADPNSVGLAARLRAHRHGQLLPTSDFYNTLLDYCDLVGDFENWESRRGKFAFCQYPFFLSIWAKIKVLEFDARRQMEVKAREAFFDSILSHKAVQQHLILKVRRDCLVEDSLKSVSEVVGTGLDEIKKGLRIVFLGEEGVDAGGLRKEWFLLLVREIFDPNHGMFIYDDESQYCYFNPHCFETSDQFFLVGVLLGLAIYNSTILDIPFPPFMFKKLLASAPNLHKPTPTNPARVMQGYDLEDLAEFRPALSRGLRQLLEFDGNVEETFCRDFVAETDRYGQIVSVPLCHNGENRPVTNANRREFVDLYVRYLLDTAVSRQFEPFKRGFYTVCGGNALSLFRPEEIELLVRGSDEPLDISSLRAVANYENWGSKNPGETEPVIQWFWELFESASPALQRQILSFVAGSDRIPAMGATNLIIRISRLGPGDSDRYPIARTCFNMLGLWQYGSKAKLEKKLWGAVTESEGFGLK